MLNVIYLCGMRSNPQHLRTHRWQFRVICRQQNCKNYLPFRQLDLMIMLIDVFLQSLRMRYTFKRRICFHYSFECTLHTCIELLIIGKVEDLIMRLIHRYHDITVQQQFKMSDQLELSGESSLDRNFQIRANNQGENQLYIPCWEEEGSNSTQYHHLIEETKFYKNKCKHLENHLEENHREFSSLNQLYLIAEANQRRLLKDNQDLRKANREIGNQLSQLKISIQSLNSQFDSTGRRESELRQKFFKGKEKQNELIGEIEQLRNQLQLLRRRQPQMQDQQKWRRMSAQQLQKAENQWNNIREQLEDNQRKLLKECEDLRRNNRDLSHEALQLKALLQTANSLADTAAKREGEFREKFIRSKQRETQAANQLQVLKSQNQLTKRKLSQQTSQKQKWKKNYNEEIVKLESNLKERNIQYQAHERKFTKENEDLKRINRDLLDELSQTKQQLQNKSSQVDSLSKRQVQTRDKLAKMKNRNDDLSNLLQSSQNELQLLKRKTVQNPFDDQKIKRQMADQLQRAEETWNFQKSELQNTNRILKREIQDSKRAIQDLNNELDEIRERLKEISTQYDSASRRQAEAKQKLATLKQRSEELQGQLIQGKRENEQLKRNQKIAEDDGIKRSYNQQIERIQDQLRNTKEDYEQNERKWLRQIEQLRRGNRQLLNQLSQANITIDMNSSSYENYMRKEQELRSKVMEAKQKENDLLHQIDMLKSEIEGLKRRPISSVQQQQRLRKEFKDQLLRQEQHWRTSNDQLQVRERQVRKELQQLKRTNNNLSLQISTLKQTIQSLSSKSVDIGNKQSDLLQKISSGKEREQEFIREIRTLKQQIQSLRKKIPQRDDGGQNSSLEDLQAEYNRQLMALKRLILYKGYKQDQGKRVKQLKAQYQSKIQSLLSDYKSMFQQMTFLKQKLIHQKSSAAPQQLHDITTIQQSWRLKLQQLSDERQVLLQRVAMWQRKYEQLRFLFEAKLQSKQQIINLLNLKLSNMEMSRPICQLNCHHR